MPNMMIDRCVCSVSAISGFNGVMESGIRAPASLELSGTVNGKEEP